MRLFWIFLALLVICNSEEFCIKSDTIILCVDSNLNGAISSIKTNQGLNLETRGYSWIGDGTYFNETNILSLNVTLSNNNSILTVIRQILYQNDCKVWLNDTYFVSSIDPSTIEWKLNIFNISTKKPFRTSISTQFNLLNISANDMYYWTMHSGIYNNQYKPFVDHLQLMNGTQVANSLYTQIGDYYVDNEIKNNAPNKQTRQVSVFPLSIFTSKFYKHGIAFIYDLNNDILLGGTMDINSEYQLFRRYYNRLSSDNSLTFTTYIRLNNGFDWRDTLNWTMNTFPNLFKPSGTPSRINNIINNIGLGMYSCAAAMDIDTMTVVNNSGANLLWDGSFWFHYQGMQLPPVNNWTSNIATSDTTNCGQHFHRGEMASRNKIASHYYNMSSIGITTLSYQNLFEWGEDVQWPLHINISNVNITNDLFLNASLFLAVYMNDSAVLDVNGNPVFEGKYHGIVLDPGVDSWFDRVVNQTYEHIYSFGDQYNGVAIDRQDWTTFFNYNRSDGYSLCANSTECASLLISWKKLANKMGDIIHNEYTKNNAIITTNYQRERMDLLIISDAIFTEQSSLTHLYSNGLSTMGMHAIEWTYNYDEVMVNYGGPNHYFQERLYLNVHSIAPVLGNDHCITPNQTVQIYYNQYNKLFRALRGCTWLLTSNTPKIIKPQQDYPLINSFIKNENGDIVIVLALGFDCAPNIVNISINVTGIIDGIKSCQYIYPNATEWEDAELNQTSGTVIVPTNFGCSVTKCQLM